MLLFFSVLFVIFASVSSTFAQVEEIQKFEEIHSYLRPNTLLILDIDDTLLVPVQMVGSDEWFTGRLNELRGNGLTAAQCFDRCLGEWEAIRHISKMELVEPGQARVVAALQKKGCMIMGMTTQGLALADRTCKQLSSEGINLSRTAPSFHDQYVDVSGHGTLFRNGVFFTSGTDKVNALFTFLDQIHYDPTHIVYVNDKRSYLTLFEKATEKRDIPYIGLRYAYSDSRKNAFRYAIADYQFHHSSFANILSDDEARKMMRDPS